MPNIREFDNTVRGLTPDNGMEQVAARNAAHTEQAFRMMGQDIGSGVATLGDAYVRVKEQQDLSHGFAAYTAMQLKHTQDLQTAMKNADPNDPTVASKFLAENVDPDVQKFVNGMSTDNGKKWATEMGGRMREELGRTAIGMQSQLAAEAVTGNLEASLSNLSGKAFLDPASRDAAFQTWVEGLDAQLSTHPTLTAEQAAKVREHYIEAGRKEIGLSSAEGMIRAAQATGPEAVTQVMDNLSKDPKWPEFLGGEGLERANALALEAHRMATNDQRSAQENAIRVQKDAAKAELAQVYASGLRPDGTWAPPPDAGKQLLDIATKYPQGVDASEMHAMSDYVQTANEHAANHTTVQDDAGLANSLWARVGTANAPSRAEILKLGAESKLSNYTVSHLLEAQSKVESDPAEKQLNEQTKLLFNAKKAFILGSSGGLGGGPTPEAQERYFEFQSAIRNAISVARAQGQTPDYIVQHQLNPASPDYLGRDDRRWMQYYHTGQLPPGQAQGNRPLPAPAASSVQPRPTNGAGQAPAGRPSLDDLDKKYGF